MLRRNYVLNGNKETSQFKIINNPDPVKGFESQYFQICLYKISAEKKEIFWQKKIANIRKSKKLKDTFWGDMVHGIMSGSWIKWHFKDRI